MIEVAHHRGAGYLDHVGLDHTHGQDRDVVHHCMLAAGTQCSYAVFAHDSVPNHAVAATLADTTAT